MRISLATICLACRPMTHLCVKPMNCPCHVQVFNQGLKVTEICPCDWLSLVPVTAMSPRDHCTALCGCAHFTQDDAHIFCTEEQIQPEVSQFIDFFHEVYADFGFDEIIYRLSTRPAERVGSDEDWDRAEAALGKRWMPKNYLGRSCQERAPFMGQRLNSR